MNAETLMQRDRVACIHPDTLALLKTGRHEDTRRVAVQPSGIICGQDGRESLYLTPSKETLELIDDLFEFVREAQCTCYAAEGKYDGHTCTRCELLARMGEPRHATMTETTHAS